MNDLSNLKLETTEFQQEVKSSRESQNLQDTRDALGECNRTRRAVNILTPICLW